MLHHVVFHFASPFKFNSPIVGLYKIFPELYSKDYVVQTGFIVWSLITAGVNRLNTKRRLLYVKTQFVPRSKHFSSRL